MRSRGLILEWNDENHTNSIAWRSGLFTIQFERRMVDHLMKVPESLSNAPMSCCSKFSRQIDPLWLGRIHLYGKR